MSRITTVSKFRERFPEFANKTDTQVGDALDIAADVNNKSDLAYYVAAHALVTDSLKNPNKVDGGVYPISGGESMGGKSLSYQLPKTDDQLSNWLQLTEYGRRYLALMRSKPQLMIAARVVE